ncbi:MAG: twin-arginine translocase TatA/TatE family subunit [Dehalococcoidales bacterium]|nr:MAG: twin-arginine translocase TatA/TatE family subunit [Dehalococcoidales bacterium]
MFKPGPLEIGLIVFIVLILFGAGKLPQVGASLGKGIRAFRRGQSGDDEPEEEEEEAPVRQVTRKTTRRKKTATRKS